MACVDSGAMCVSVASVKAGGLRPGGCWGKAGQALRNCWQSVGTVSGGTGGFHWSYGSGYVW